MRRSEKVSRRPKWSATEGAALWVGTSSAIPIENSDIADRDICSDRSFGGNLGGPILALLRWTPDVVS
jgi:hypothetical protein